MRILNFILLTVLFIAPALSSTAQKKPLDHSVYDSWQSLGDRQINANGEWIAYAIDVQEGDGILMILKADSSFVLSVPRGYDFRFSPDGLHLIGKIKPLYRDTRAAKIKKVKQDEFPQDSLFVFDVTEKNIQKFGGIKSYKIPEKEGEWVAYSTAKTKPEVSKPAISKDSFKAVIDTTKARVPVIIEQVPDRKQKRKLSAQEKKEDDPEALAVTDADDEAPGSAGSQEGTDLIVRSLNGKSSITFKGISDYYWTENGKILLLESTSLKNDKTQVPAVFIWRSIENRVDTLLRGGNDFRSFAISESSNKIAFLAERDTAIKTNQKFYGLWYWENGDKEATLLADRFTPGMKLNWSISENATLSFSKSGQRLFFGVAPVKPLKDTTLIEMDLVKLDIWHYNDDYLQPYQLRRLNQDKNQSYLAMIDLPKKNFVQLADQSMPQVILSDNGDGSFFAGTSDIGKRIPMQWEGSTKRDIYTVNPQDGSRKIIAQDLSGFPQFSPGGRYLLWYDAVAKHFFSFDSGRIVNISKNIPQKLYDEEYDMPSDPTPYGVMRWHEKDSFVYVYDRFDIWKLDPKGKAKPENLTYGAGRKNQIRYRFIETDPESRFIQSGQQLLFRTFNERNKNSGLASLLNCCGSKIIHLQEGPYSIGQVIKARKVWQYLYSSESYDQSPAVYISKTLTDGKRMSALNPQQHDYNWMTAELFSWKAYDGKLATGIVYKPADYQPGKKYPMIAYFYETLSDGLFNYLPPAPTPSRLNIPFFVSRGYIVLAPDIRYTKGYPGKAAYDYVVSGARALVKRGWVDSTKMGIQGQSWGGYQVAHIITRTPLFAAAWAGAPVANMTSAYGGIRWESGMNRQFQYEKSQSRIGATLWEKPQLYIENSPLFHLPKVKTPLVIMSNDNDGAVPWYQGIEMFTAMRRLGKKVWMLNYNGEAHNLVERKNRKDIQIREQQFFDWLLKGEKPTVWLTDGVPAIEKGRTWGLDTKLN